MKDFEIQDCFKPMISKPGQIASRRNNFFLKSLIKNPNESLEIDSIREILAPKLPKILNQRASSSSKVQASHFFKSIGRAQVDKFDSPPPNRYKPNYDFLLKKSPAASFSKSTMKKKLKGKNKRLTTPDVSASHSIESPQKIKGIPFEKQLKRKTIYSSENPHEKRFENVHEDMLQNNKVHSFASYTPRKLYYQVLEFMPDYSPNYDFVSKPSRSRRCD